MISITYYYNVFRKYITKKCILGRQYEYWGKSLRGWTADGTRVFVRTMDDFDVSREETHGSTTDIYHTWQTEDHSLFPKCHFVKVPPRLGNVRTARKRLKKMYIYFFWCKIQTVGRHGLDWSGSEQCQVVGSSECSNKPSVFIKCKEFLD